MATHQIACFVQTGYSVVVGNQSTNLKQDDREDLSVAMDKNLVFATVRELGELIRTRQLSPVELTEAYLSRLETIGPKLGAVITVTRNLAMEQAKAAEKEIKAGRYRGPLHGIPYGVKDAFSAKGIPTTWGIAPYRN
jgi:Asp-tRNA(Asn)/Glu-tRNA(Gln) amidotransferase A subunit family amidase